MSNPFLRIVRAFNIVFASLQYGALAVLSFCLFFILYLFLLSATFTGGRVGLVSLRLITLKLAMFAFLFASLIAFIVSFSVYAFRMRRDTKKTFSVSGSFIGSVLPPFLCCSPILPSMGAFAAGMFPAAPAVSGFVQGFLATYETQVFSVIAVVLAYSLYQNSKHVIYAFQGTCEF